MYELSPHRYRELKHFCLQYQEMKDKISELDGKEVENSRDPTSKVAVTRTDLQNAVKLIEMTAYDLGKFPGDKILKIVTENRTAGEVCPFDSDICKMYLKKFFWLLSERKGV